MYSAAIARRLLAEWCKQRVDPARAFVAGGTMALILAICEPDLFSAVAVHSGPYRSADDVASAFAVWAGGARTDRPSLVVHGTADRTVAPENARQLTRHPANEATESISG